MTDALKTHIRAGQRANAQAINRLLLAGPDLDLAAAAELEDRFDRLDALERREQMIPRISKIGEPDIYSPNGPHSFVRDMVDAQGVALFPGSDPGGALERLQRHQNYVDSHRKVDRAVLDREGVTAGPQTRALSTLTGAGGEFTAPAWLLDQWASVARGVAPLRSLVHRLPLPPGCETVSVPRFDVSAGVLARQAENTTPNIAESSTDSLTATVVNIAGIVPLSMQLFERGPGFDRIVTADLAESYAAVLESQLIDGTGANGQHLGILNVSTIEAVTYTTASPTPTKVVQAIGQAAAKVGNARKRPPSAVLLRPARYSWIMASADGSGNEPVSRPGTGAIPVDADAGPFGPIAGLPTFLSDGVPADLGSGTNQDTAIAVRASDLLLLEDEAPKVSAIVDSAAGGASMTVFLVAHCYSAFIPGRYPAAIGQALGTGFVTPAGW